MEAALLDRGVELYAVAADKLYPFRLRGVGLTAADLRLVAELAALLAGDATTPGRSAPGDGGAG